ncbi:MAG: DUF1385 domain-containing protein [Candidatus Harrisonbacteria bacterium]|nr:DUF1385 domain-containing protein [Candidatus Harrisonbacteria bacterium]
MIVPILGYVGKPTFDISGSSSRNGFRLEIRKANVDQPVNFSITDFDEYNDFTRSYSHRARLLEMFVGFLISTAIIALASILKKLSLLEIGITSFFLSLTIQILITNLSTLWHLRQDSENREWHAAEHKSVVVLEAGLEPTVENLKKCPANLMFCGSVQMGIMMEICLLSVIANLFYLMPVEFWSILLTPTIISFLEITIIAAFGMWIPILILSITAIILSPVKYRYQFVNLTLVLSIPIAAIPLLGEKFFALKEPSEEKLRRTAEELKEFIEETDIYQN